MHVEHIYRPSTGSWFIIPSSTGIAYGVAWGVRQIYQ